MSQLQLAQPSSASATEELFAPVDLAALARWMDENGLESGPIHALSQIGGGTQNILLRFWRGEREFILRHPPAHPRPDSNKTMLRESRVLAALASTVVPHPRLIAKCVDESVLGAVFYLMEPIAGFNATVAMPREAKESPELRHVMGLALIDGLVTLANVDHEAVGLSDFGRLEGFLERQVGRWAAELESYHRFPEWTGRGELGDVHGIGAWLERNRPAGMKPGIMHGDYHIGNVLYNTDGSLAAIVDWEMATLGDPLMDLGRLLSTWPDSDGPSALSMRVEPSSEFPTREALIARYARTSARDLSNLPWFEILACYKLAILLEGTYARAQAGKADTTTGARLHATAIALLNRARQRITSN
ncbi:phosphotransferase family protein [Cupriavidus necator]|uniref:phosphotransferase family protein n=1 Tax=Cupriavidus necator TaxID=106590 RepID=UPI003ECC5B28